jgi:hypothetical protein
VCPKGWTKSTFPNKTIILKNEQCKFKQKEKKIGNDGSFIGVKSIGPKAKF